MSQALLRLRIVAEFDSDTDIFDRTHGGLNSERGRKELEPLLSAWEQGVPTTEAAWELHHVGVTTTYVGDRPGPPTSSAQSIRDWCLSVGNQTLLHCRQTLYAKSHPNGVINCCFRNLSLYYNSCLFLLRLLTLSYWTEQSTVHAACCICIKCIIAWTNIFFLR